MAISKADLVDHLFNVLGINKREAREVVDALFEEISKALERGEGVKLSSFGTFTLRDKNSRPGRNPKTGEEIAITARRVVSFKAGEKLKSRVVTHAGSEQKNQDESS